MLRTRPQGCIIMPASPANSAKEEDMEDIIICYCFHYTRADIEKDIAENRSSTMMEKIIREKQSGNCRCALLNPKGK